MVSQAFKVPPDCRVILAPLVETAIKVVRVETAKTGSMAKQVFRARPETGEREEKMVPWDHQDHKVS